MTNTHYLIGISESLCLHLRQPLLAVGMSLTFASKISSSPPEEVAVASTQTVWSRNKNGSVFSSAMERDQFSEMYRKLSSRAKIIVWGLGVCQPWVLVNVLMVTLIDFSQAQTACVHYLMLG